MTGRERLMATLYGQPVDRPAVNFCEIGGFTVDPNDPDPFNIYNASSWQPLLKLAEENTDLIKFKSPVRAQSHLAWGDEGSKETSIRDEFFKVEQFEQSGCRMTRTTITVAGKQLTSLTRREPDIDTVWAIEHLLKSKEDIEAYLQLPDEVFTEHIDTDHLVQAEQALGDRGLVMVDTEDPICAAAGLFSMEDYTIIAISEKKLFHKLLEKCSRYIYARTEKTAKEFPGRLWRIYGPEYATEPFLPPALFREFVVRYTKPMVEMIQKEKGFVRIHSHGRIKNVLDDIVSMGADAIDPVEAPPHGDIELRQVKEKYSNRLVLFGNIQIADIENMPTELFKEKIKRTLEDGTAGNSRGFVLMPTASPYGREITSTTMANYETMVHFVLN